MCFIESQTFKYLFLKFFGIDSISIHQALVLRLDSKRFYILLKNRLRSNSRIHESVLVENIKKNRKWLNGILSSKNLSNAYSAIAEYDVLGRLGTSGRIASVWANPSSSVHENDEYSLVYTYFRFFSTKLGKLDKVNPRFLKLFAGLAINIRQQAQIFTDYPVRECNRSLP